MNHLREEGCDVFGDLAPQRLGGAVPDAFGPDEHVTPSLSSARAISSATASAESLLSPASGGRGTRGAPAPPSGAAGHSWSAARGSFTTRRLEWATRS